MAFHQAIIHCLSPIKRAHRPFHFAHHRHRSHISGVGIVRVSGFSPHTARRCVDVQIGSEILIARTGFDTCRIDM